MRLESASLITSTGSAHRLYSFARWLRSSPQYFLHSVASGSRDGSAPLQKQSGCGAGGVDVFPQQTLMVANAIETSRIMLEPSIGQEKPKPSSGKTVAAKARMAQ